MAEIEGYFGILSIIVIEPSEKTPLGQGEEHDDATWSRLYPGHKGRKTHTSRSMQDFLAGEGAVWSVKKSTPRASQPPRKGIPFSTSGINVLHGILPFQ